MRAREFFKETGPTLADALMAAAAKAREAQAPKIGQPTDPNAVKQGTGTQSSQGTASPAQATTGGTQTPQAAAQKPAGIGSSFISGLTKGKADSLGGVADLAKQKLAGAAAGSLGMKGTVSALGKMGSTAAQQASTLQKPEEIGMALKAGQNIDLPNVGKITITKSTPQGIELDTSKAPAIGLPKLTLNPKDLLKK